MSYENEQGDTIISDNDVYKTYTIEGVTFDVVGFDWNEDQRRWEYFDLWQGDQHLNPGEPWDQESGAPTRQTVREYVETCFPELLE